MAFVAALSYDKDRLAIRMAASHDSTPPGRKKRLERAALTRWGSRTFELFRRMHAFGMLLNKG